jgi:hypothetical protein
MYSGGKDRHLYSGSASLSQCRTSDLGAQLCLLSRLTACHAIVFLPEWMTLLSAIGFRKRWRSGINSMARPQRLSTAASRVQRSLLRFLDFDCPFKILNGLTRDIHPVVLHATMK